ncbi:hypothetical protein [uncultured Cohaesibacter sp.]|uniref:hypothetical protein n=1 Tax=uncultured Cohaesibacter sp. TaxID=1002546 RepID=UPI0029C6F085|nr:hypothetical protein [uncultured Cohaesibacter sp.]
MEETNKEDPVAEALYGDERLEWRASPNWDLAERRKRSLRPLLLITTLTVLSSLVSALVVMKSASLHNGSPDRPMAIAIMSIVFSITGYLWLHLTRRYFDLQMPAPKATRIHYALTDQRLIVIPEGAGALDVRADQYRLSRASLQPNGLVHDLELQFESRAQKEQSSVIGPVFLRALENADDIMAAIVEQFATDQWPFHSPLGQKGPHRPDWSGRSNLYDSRAAAP